MRKTLFLTLIPLLSLYAALSQGQGAIGYTAASLNSNGAFAGGLSIALGYNVVEWTNSSLSLSTNWKIGFQDKIGGALILPLAFAGGGSSPPSTGTDGGTIHLFMELPLLVHYNFGFGSASKSDLHNNFGFYLGCGVSAISTGYADTAGYSRKASFAGYVADGGIRFNRTTDLNFATVLSFQGPIGQIRRPILFELTLSALFPR